MCLHSIHSQSYVDTFYVYLVFVLKAVRGSRVLYGGIETVFLWHRKPRDLSNSLAMRFSRAKSVWSCTPSNQAISKE